MNNSPGYVEVTRDMVEAGVDELFRHPIMEPDESAMRFAVEQVYRAMEVVRLKMSAAAEYDGK
jgi:hypothetical protein